MIEKIYAITIDKHLCKYDWKQFYANSENIYA